MNLRRDHFLVLLNALDALDVETITVDHPAESVGRILQIRLHDENPTATVQCRLRPDEYRDARESIHLDYGDRPHDDLPDYHAIVAAMTGSGVIDLANQGAVEEYLDSVCYPAVGSGEPPVMIGIDANVFPWGFPETLGIDHRTGSTDDAGRRPTNGYALSNGVVDELHWQFSHYNVDPLVEAFGEEFSRLEDQPGGSKREGRLGIQAYQTLIATRNVDLVDSQSGDDAIIDGYRRYDEANRKRPLLLSNDREFIRKAADADLYAQHLAFKSSLPRRTTASWAEVADCLFNLAILFGVLKLPKVTLYGVWNGKEDTHWQTDQIDIDCRGSQSAIKPILARHRRIAECFDNM